MPCYQSFTLEFIKKTIRNVHLILSKVANIDKKKKQINDLMRQDMRSHKSRKWNENGRTSVINVTPLTLTETYQQVWEYYCRW